MGCIGMSVDDFCRCTFDEFEAICKAWREMNEGHTRDAWERMRMTAAITIQPHVRKKISPRQLLPLPWDYEKPAPKTEAPTLSPEQRQQRFASLTQKL